MTSPLRTIVLPAVPRLPRSAVPDLQWPTKQPDEFLDYAADATGPLTDSADAVATITASVAPSGAGELQLSRLAVSNALIALWGAGGVAGRGYIVRLEAVTFGGRTFEWLIALQLSPLLAASPIPAAPSENFGNAVTWTWTPRLDFSQPRNSFYLL